MNQLIDRKYQEATNDEIAIFIKRLLDRLDIVHERTILIHVIGGQNKLFFKNICELEGIELLQRRTAFKGLFKLLSFIIPSQEGLLNVSEQNAINTACKYIHF